MRNAVQSDIFRVFDAPARAGAGYGKSHPAKTSIGYACEVNQTSMNSRPRMNSKAHFDLIGNWFAKLIVCPKMFEVVFDLVVKKTASSN